MSKLITYCNYYHVNDTVFLHRLLPNGCEVDLTVCEEFPIDSLLEFIEAFIEVYQCSKDFILHVHQLYIAGTNWV